MLRRIAALLLLNACAFAQQSTDESFVTSVAAPAYTTQHPLVLIDEAHNNFHTASGRYAPFAELLRKDGYRVKPNTANFDKPLHADVLVISNARGASAPADPAFTDVECAAIYNWVRDGGALLLIADHAPFGAAASKLAAKFGIGMGQGFVMDTDAAHTSGNPSVLAFSRENGLLGDHPITRGRNESERIKNVVAFTGQSLQPPAGANVILRLGSGTFEVPGRTESEQALRALGISTDGSKTDADPSALQEIKKKFPVGGQTQGFAIRMGKGRVVVVGEAAMFSAQVLTFPDATGAEREFKMGMNVPGNDDRQFALNVLHWLSGLLR